MSSLADKVQLIKELKSNPSFPSAPVGAKEQLNREIEEVKQSKDELEVRMSALKSQYEGRLLRLDRELRELKESQAQPEPREEPLDQSGAKVPVHSERTNLPLK